MKNVSACRNCLFGCSLLDMQPSAIRIVFALPRQIVELLGLENNKSRR